MPIPIHRSRCRKSRLMQNLHEFPFLFRRQTTHIHPTRRFQIRRRQVISFRFDRSERDSTESMEFEDQGLRGTGGEGLLRFGLTGNATTGGGDGCELGTFVIAVTIATRVFYQSGSSSTLNEIDISFLTDSDTGAHTRDGGKGFSVGVGMKSKMIESKVCQAVAIICGIYEISKSKFPQASNP